MDFRNRTRKEYKLFSRFTSSHLVRRRMFFGFVALTIASITIVFVLYKVLLLMVYMEPEFCFDREEIKDGRTLQNIAENPILKGFDNDGKNIFFTETSCIADGVIELNSREACAIESSALINPDREVFVLFTSPIGFRSSTPLPVIDALLTYPNVHLNYLNITQYAENTPLAEWIKTGKLFRSTYVNTHTSDVLRLLSLWKYGGTYLDLDIIMLKPLSLLEPNFVGAESRSYCNDAILNLEGESGHEIADLCVKDILENFSTSDWGGNGPKVITRVMRAMCNIKVSEMISMRKCGNLNVMPIETFYAISGPEYGKLFKEEFLDETMDRLKNSVITHVWNKLSGSMPLSLDSNAAYMNLAREKCPRVVKASQAF